MRRLVLTQLLLSLHCVSVLRGGNADDTPAIPSGDKGFFCACHRPLEHDGAPLYTPTRNSPERPPYTHACADAGVENNGVDESTRQFDEGLAAFNRKVCAYLYGNKTRDRIGGRSVIVRLCVCVCVYVCAYVCVYMCV